MVLCLALIDEQQQQQQEEEEEEEEEKGEGVGEEGEEKEEKEGKGKEKAKEAERSHLEGILEDFEGGTGDWNAVGNAMELIELLVIQSTVAILSEVEEERERKTKTR